MLLAGSPPAWLVDTDVHFSGDGYIKSQQAVAAWGKGWKLSLHASREPVGTVLTHINLTEVPEHRQKINSHIN